MFEQSNSRPAQVACATASKTKNDRENLKRGYEGQIEEPYPGKKTFKVQEGLFNAMKKFIVRWEWQKHPKRCRNDTYN